MYMSLNQNHIKIKLFLNILIIIEICTILSSCIIIYSKFNYKSEIVYKHSHFEAAFIKQLVNKEDKVQEKESNTDLIIASKNGVRYYYENCSGIKRIKVENRVYFSSEKEAENAGYTIANNCKKP